MKTFFVKSGEWGIKNSSFHTDFKNVNLILVTSAAKKSFSQKNCFINGKISFLGKTYLGASFYLGQMYIFEI